MTPGWAALLLLCGYARADSLEDLGRKSQAALYDLEYERSRAVIRGYIAERPQDPFGYLHEAGSIWWQSTNEAALEGAPDLEERFELAVAEALARAKPYLDSPDPKRRAQGHFVAGMALGGRGQWQLLRRRWLKAYRDGRRAVRHLNRCVKEDPEFYDAYLGLGIYDYQADRLPGILKLSALVGVRGDARRGLERMRLAMERGRIGSSQAALFLASIRLLDDRERDEAEALRLVRRLRSLHPKSPYFQFLELTALHRLGDFDGSLREARSLFARLPEDPELLGRKLPSLLCGLTGEKCLSGPELSAAAGWLGRALAAEPRKDAPWAGLLRFFRGAAYDSLGRREEAVAEYGRSLAAEPLASVQTKARSCLLSACGRGELLRMLKAATLTAGAAR